MFKLATYFESWFKFFNVLLKFLANFVRIFCIGLLKIGANKVKDRLKRFTLTFVKWFFEILLIKF